MLGTFSFHLDYLLKEPHLDSDSLNGSVCAVVANTTHRRFVHEFLLLLSPFTLHCVPVEAFAHFYLPKERS